MIPIGTKLDQITQEQLRHRLHYAPETGVFTWKVTQFACHVGKVAGSRQGGQDGRYYLSINLHGKSYQAHLLAWLWMIGSMPTTRIYHLDNNGLNNKWHNLSNVTKTAELCNTELTQDMLKHKLNYDPNNGIFTWLASHKNHIGEQAGYRSITPSTGEACLRIKLYKKLYSANNLAWLYMTGSFPINDIDHLDGNKLNNKWDNLIEIDHNNLNQEYLKYRLHYDPAIGIFIWKVAKYDVVGTPAGQAQRSKGKHTYYLRINLNGKTYAAHRLAFLYMTGSFPTDQIDHIDGNGLNNKWDNLRNVTNSENQQNTRLRVTNTSGVPGVFFCTRDKSWIATIAKNKQKFCLGYFKNKEDAIQARLNAERGLGFHPNHGKR